MVAMCFYNLLLCYCSARGYFGCEESGENGSKGNRGSWIPRISCHSNPNDKGEEARFARAQNYVGVQASPSFHSCFSLKSGFNAMKQFLLLSKMVGST